MSEVLDKASKETPEAVVERNLESVTEESCRTSEDGVVKESGVVGGEREGEEAGVPTEEVGRGRKRERDEEEGEVDRGQGGEGGKRVRVEVDEKDKDGLKEVDGSGEGLGSSKVEGERKRTREEGEGVSEQGETQTREEEDRPPSKRTKLETKTEGKIMLDFMKIQTTYSN